MQFSLKLYISNAKQQKQKHGGQERRMLFKTTRNFEVQSFGEKLRRDQYSHGPETEPLKRLRTGTVLTRDRQT